MYKILKIVAIALGILGVILCGGVLFAGVEPWADFLFWVSYALLAIALVSVLIFGFVNIVSSPEKIKKTLIYTGVFVVILIISYVLASGADSTEKMVGAGINAFFILGGLAVVLMVASGVKNALTK